MKLPTDDLNDTIEAPLRPDPKPLPELGKIASLRKKHLELVEQHAKAMERRDQVIAKLRRADDKVRDLRKALARSSLRLEAQRMLDALPNTMHDDEIRAGVQ